MPPAKKKTETTPDLKDLLDAPLEDAAPVPEVTDLPGAQPAGDVAPDRPAPSPQSEPESGSSDGASDGLAPEPEEQVRVGDPCARCYPKGWEAIGEEPGVRASCAHGYTAEYGKFTVMPMSRAIELGFSEKE